MLEQRQSRAEAGTMQTTKNRKWMAFASNQPSEAGLAMKAKMRTIEACKVPMSKGRRGDDETYCSRNTKSASAYLMSAPMNAPLARYEGVYGKSPMAKVDHARFENENEHGAAK